MQNYSPTFCFSRTSAASNSTSRLIIRSGATLGERISVEPELTCVMCQEPGEACV